MRVTIPFRKTEFKTLLRGAAPRARKGSDRVSPTFRARLNFAEEVFEAGLVQAG